MSKLKKGKKNTMKEGMLAVPHISVEKRYVCVFCYRIFPRFFEIDKHFSKYHKLRSVDDTSDI